MTPPVALPGPRAGLARRFAAMFYDALLLIACLFVATFPVLLFTDGEAVSPYDRRFLGYLTGLGFLYFCWPWTHTGQTLGMKSWRIAVYDQSSHALSWPQAASRFVLAGLSLSAFGLGFWYALLDRDRLALHDRLTKTYLVLKASH